METVCVLVLIYSSIPSLLQTAAGVMLKQWQAKYAIVQAVLGAGIAPL